MRRSRRSLWLLLAVMVLSLGLLRLTTQPSIPTAAASPATDRTAPPPVHGRSALRPRPARFWRKECLAVCQALAAGPRTIAGRCQRFNDRLAASLAVCQSMLNSANCLGTRESLYDTGRTAGRARAAVSLIVVLRLEDQADSTRYRTGWSGCDTYAFGCDHLGRSLNEGQVAAGHPRRVLLHGFGRLVGLASDVARQAAAIIESGPPATASLANTPL